MKKYIDADRLREEIKIIQKSLEQRDVRFNQIKQIRTNCMIEFCEMLNNVIASLQQEQPETDGDDGKFVKILVRKEYAEQIQRLGDEILAGQSSFIGAMNQREQPDLPGIEESGIPGKDYIPVEWVDACEKYGKWKIVKQEQPEVDLEKEYKTWWNSISGKINVEHIMEYYMHETARHFYELGKNSK